MEVKTLTGTPQAFISYAAEDVKYAKYIYSILYRYNLRVFLDINEIHAGQNIREVISEAINESAIIIALISENSIQSRWVNEELKLALSRRNEDNDRFIIPIIIGDLEPPGFIRETRYIRTEGTDWLRSIRYELERAIRGILFELNLKREVSLINDVYIEDWSQELSDLYVTKEGLIGTEDGFSAVIKQSAKPVKADPKEVKKVIEALEYSAASYKQRATLTLISMGALIMVGLYIFLFAGNITYNEQVINKPLQVHPIKTDSLQRH